MARIYIGSTTGTNADVNWETFPVSFETDREVVQVGALGSSFYSSGAERLALRSAIIWTNDASAVAFLTRDLMGHILDNSSANAQAIYIQPPVEFYDPRKSVINNIGQFISDASGNAIKFQATNTEISHITDPYRAGTAPTFVKLQLDLEEVV